MSDSQSDRFDDLLRDAAAHYHRPPADRDLPLDAMWTAIDAATFGDSARDAARTRRAGRYHLLPRRAWIGIAAALIGGVAIGRLSARAGDRDEARSAPLASAAARGPAAPATPAAAASGARDSVPIDAATSRYFGQAAALLVSLPADAGSPRVADEHLLTRASDLLLTTRLLLDSPSASDPATRTLLEDLELVLVQVVRLAGDRERARGTELELIHQALDQREVLPRLRDAVTERGSAD